MHRLVYTFDWCSKSVPRLSQDSDELLGVNGSRRYCVCTEEGIGLEASKQGGDTV